MATVAAAAPKSAAGKHIQAMIAAKLAGKKQAKAESDPVDERAEVGSGSSKKRGKRKRGSKAGKKKKRAKTEEDGHVSA